MPLVPNSPATESRTTLQAILVAEFTDITPLLVKNGKLDNSLGMDSAITGAYPSDERPNPADRMELITTVVVQYFGRWSADGDPQQPLDPAPVEALADRYRRAIGSYKQAGDSNVWWFAVEDVAYPHDPTGRLTRFVMTVHAHGTNPAP